MKNTIKRSLVGILAVLITISGLYTPEYLYAAELQDEVFAGSGKIGLEEIEESGFLTSDVIEEYDAALDEEVSANCSLYDLDDVESSMESDEFTPLPVDADAPRLNKSLIAMKPGETKVLTIKNLPEGESVTWPDSDKYTKYEPFGEGNCSCRVTAFSSYYGMSSCTVSDNSYYYWAEAGLMTKNKTYTIEAKNGKVKKIKGRYDFKKMAKFLQIVNTNRLALGNNFLRIGFSSSKGSYIRAREMPFTKESFVRPNGSAAKTAYDNDSDTPIWRSEWFGRKMNMQTCYNQMRQNSNCASAMDSSSTTAISAVVFKTTKNYKVMGTPYNEFMAVAYGY